jgi:membrane metallo-endopeptidase-like protein 1
MALQENIADLVGPDVAYLAYQEWVRDHGQEPNLPGLNYTSNQIFWIMSGAFKCHQPKLRFSLRFDQHHGVPSFAVGFSKKNSAAFASDFNCPLGSEMNPEKKCQIL